MANEFKGADGHSAEYFGDTRDHWWNRDFLELMVKRWRLDVIRDVLDVGCGVGHWGQLLGELLPEGVRVTGVDREADWIAHATSRARARGLADRFLYLPGEADRLPFPDDSFDLTTCQTVLIHVVDPGAVIAEMTRVTRPGGLVMVAEPNNLTGALLLDSITNQSSIAELVELVRFQLTCERGKIALGEGDNSLGDRVAGLFAAQGLVEVDAYLNDKAAAIFPPYSSSEHQAFVADTCDRAERSFWIWSEAETRRYFVAGGGAEPEFAVHFARALAAGRRIVRGLEEGTYHGAGGGAFYLVAGRKRA
jgi:SAM-dependent methyltransferase